MVLKFSVASSIFNLNKHKDGALREIERKCPYVHMYAKTCWEFPQRLLETL
jgi:hypothetical protein